MALFAEPMLVPKVGGLATKFPGFAASRIWSAPIGLNSLPGFVLKRIPSPPSRIRAPTTQMA